MWQFVDNRHRDLWN